MLEESFGTLQLGFLTPDTGELCCDDGISLEFAPVQNQTNVSQADSHVLACAQHPESAQMFLAVVAMAWR